MKITGPTAVSHVLSMWHYFAISALVLLFYFPLIVPGMGLPAAGDFFAYHAPNRVITSWSLHAGQIPFRTNELFGGYPLFQDPQFALLYPVNLLFGLIVANPATQGALDFYVLINILLFGLSSLFFLRSFGLSRIPALAGAVAVCFNGYMCARITQINVVQTLGMDLVAAGCLTRFAMRGHNFHWVLVTAMALAAGTLAGHPQTTMYMHYAIAAGMAIFGLQQSIQLRNSRLFFSISGAAITAMLLGLLLAAVQLIPTLELLRISSRVEMSRGAAIWSPLKPEQLFQIIWPGLFRQSIFDAAEIPGQRLQWLGGYFWESYMAFGVTAYSLGVIGWFSHRRTWPVHVLGLGCCFLLACALGDKLPFYGWLYDFVPGMKLVRIPTRLLVIFFPAWGILTALGAAAILHNRQSPRFTMLAFIGCLALIALVLCWRILAVYQGDRIGAFVQFVSAGYSQNVKLLLSHKPEFKIAVVSQIIITASATLVLLFCLTARSGRTTNAPLLLAALLLELTIYNFGLTTIKNPGINHGIHDAGLDALPQAISGRAIVLAHPIQPNAAMLERKPITQGYSVTVDSWVSQLLPQTTLPWRSGIDDLLLNLWNVSDMAFYRHPQAATIGNNVLAIDNWGWTGIGTSWRPDTGETSESERAIMPRRYAMDFETTQPVMALHIIAFAGRSQNFPDETEIARVVADTSAADGTATAAIVLGRHVSDARYPDEPAAASVRHSRAPVAYRSHRPDLDDDVIPLYDAALPIETTSPLKRLTFEATGPWPTVLAIAQVVAVLNDGSQVIRSTLPAGFKEIPSRNIWMRAMQREESPGYVHMLPGATAGDYRDRKNFVWQLFYATSDPLQNIIIDGQDITTSDIRCLNAPVPSTFRGAVNIEWQNPELVTVRTSANQQGWLLLGYAFDPGWKATIDGTPVRIFRTNGAFMAMPVNGGDHTVRLSYLPKGLISGSIITCACLILWLLLLFRFSNRRQLTSLGCVAASSE